ncbi:MAG: hypothetical protein U0625_01075 [Phycisphaerales bacterium]
MDSPKRRTQVRHAGAFLESAERRAGGARVPHDGHIVVLWHHDPMRSCAYETSDTSESGARIRSTCPLLDGMTGVAVCLNPGEIVIDRTVMVVWSRGIRDADGRVTHHEAGLRFF